MSAPLVARGVAAHKQRGAGQVLACDALWHRPAAQHRHHRCRQQGQRHAAQHDASREDEGVGGAGGQLGPRLQVVVSSHLDLACTEKCLVS